MNRPTWLADGYVPRGVFRGAYACNYRLTHLREDGLAVCTVGDQRHGGRLEPIEDRQDNRLEPVAMGQPFLTVVLYPPADGKPPGDTEWLASATATTWQDAKAQHYAFMDEYADKGHPR